MLLEKSFLGIIGKSTDALFAPIGFDWKMTVALESGLAAKEALSPTLGVLYALGSEVDEGNESLIVYLKSKFHLHLFSFAYHLCDVLSAVYGSKHCVHERDGKLQIPLLSVCLYDRDCVGIGRL